MTLRTIGIIWRKELLETLRDRRALLFMIVLPIAVVPLLMIAMGKLVAIGKKKLLEEPSRVAILNADASPKLAGLIRSLESPLASLGGPPELMAAQLEEAEQNPPDPAAAAAALKDVDLSRVQLVRLVDPPADEAAARAAIQAKTLDLALLVPDGFDRDLAAERQVTLPVVYDSSVDKSKVAWKKVRDGLSRFERGTVLFRLPRHDIDRTLLDPVRLDVRTIATKELEGRAILALILPYMLILMCFSGAVYPATDLGAGEKERGTLETLLVSPADRSELVVGKLLVVFATSLLAAALNIASLAFSLKSGVFLDLGASIPLSVDPFAAVVALLLMLPVAAIFASVLLSISIFAKSFKEAQAWFAPFNVAIIVPSFVSAIPGVELTRGLALAPIVNVSLAIKEALSGVYKWDCLALILVSTLALAAVCVAFCTRWFKREEVLFRS